VWFDGSGGQAGAILLFDEADALFGKAHRGEGQPRPLRQTWRVSYLLPAHGGVNRGLAVLTTKNMRHCDRSRLSLRRIRFIVEFPVPGRGGSRARIWRGGVSLRPRRPKGWTPIGWRGSTSPGGP